MSRDSVHITHPSDKGDGKAPDRYAVIYRCIMESPRLTPTAKLLFAGLQLYGWRDGICSASVATLAQAIGSAAGTVKAALRQLEAHGLIEILPGQDNPTGRAIVLRWIQDASVIASLAAKRSSVAPDPGQNLTPQGVKNCPPGGVKNRPRSIWRETENVLVDVPRQNENGSRLKDGKTEETHRPQPVPAPEAGTTATASPRPAAPVVPVSTAALISSLATTPANVGPVAVRLSSELCDLGSRGYYLGCAREVAQGQSPADRLVEAFRTAIDARQRGHGRPGAVFSAVWRDWRPGLQPDRRPAEAPLPPDVVLTPEQRRRYAPTPRRQDPTHEPARGDRPGDAGQAVGLAFARVRRRIPGPPTQELAAACVGGARSTDPGGDHVGS